MRKIKVAAIQPLMQYLCPESDLTAYIHNQLNTTLTLLEQAGREGCDIVATCEDVAHVSNFAVEIDSDIFEKLVDTSTPIVETALSQMAKKHSMYIVGAYLAKREGRIYNLASIFDRQGNIVGEYRKTHLPVGETWQVVPGEDINVFELDFGKIGISICYDIVFPEMVQTLALKGAEIIFHPTYGYGSYDVIGEATLKVRAHDNNVYLVTAKSAMYNGAGKSSVIDCWGHVLADAGFGQNVIVTRDIDLDSKKQQPAWFFNGALTAETEAGQRIRKERRPELYGEICNTNIQKVRIPTEAEKQQLLAGIRTGEIRWN